MEKEEMKRGYFMLRTWKKTIAVLLAAAVLLCMAGCKKDFTNAESAVQVYLTALAGFNVDAMEAILTEGTSEDMGVDLSAYEQDFVVTDDHRATLDILYKTLCETVEFQINSSEQVEKDTVQVYVTLKRADVKEAEVDEYLQASMDAYVEAHPGLLQMTEQEQTNIGIAVMTEAYKEFVQMQPETEKELGILVRETDGKWKIVNDGGNSELKQWLSDMFGIL